LNFSSHSTIDFRKVGDWQLGFAILEVLEEFEMRRYREIAYGVLTGLGIWVIDAMLQVGGRDHFGFDTVVSEMILSRPPQLLLRVSLLLISVALGYSLWQSRERERRMRDLQTLLKSLQRQIVSPSLPILGHSSNLALREGWPVSRESVEMMSEIQCNARKLNEIIRQWPETDYTPTATDEKQRAQYNTGGA
jgi:hypothetical protein